MGKRIRLKPELEELVKAFDIHMQKFQDIKEGSRGNYLSWIRFLFLDYENDLLKMSTEDDVQKILKKEAGQQLLQDRTKYRTKDDLTNFKSTLHTFLPFIGVWRIQQREMALVKDYDDKIAMIEKAPTRESADHYYQSLMLESLMKVYSFSKEQSARILKALALHDCKINADKLFMPGSACYSSPQK